MASYKQSKQSKAKAKKTTERPVQTTVDPDDESPIRRKTSDEVEKETTDAPEDMGDPRYKTTETEENEDMQMAMYLAKKYWYVLVILAYIILKK